MIKLLRPDLLKKLIQHDRTVKEAIAMLKNDWMTTFSGYLAPPKIDAQVVMIAKKLAEADLFKSQVNFSNYDSVRRYLVRNDNYLAPSAKRALLAPFREL